MDDEYVDIRPWPMVELAGTLTARAALVRRALIEDDANTSDYERETDRFELESWARLELGAWLDAGSFAILEASIGTLASDQVTRCDDAAIEASSIGWAMDLAGVGSLPVFTEGNPEAAAVEWAPGPWTRVRSVVKRLRLRSDEALAAERERWELIYWRLSLPEPLDDDSIAALRDVIGEVTGTGVVPVVSGDLATDAGEAFGEFDADLREAYAMEAELRLRSLNWVCGFGQTIGSAPLILDDDDALD